VRVRVCVCVCVCDCFVLHVGVVWYVRYMCVGCTCVCVHVLEDV